ncbi:hypothetical protein [Fulvivirga sediminis]|uniref:VLRF1 domain-containing protein n=1 Tax=Fulvivirga sediminis TaxID=2803949 RepID=A0A937K039_9BACT|nr:hypothetical protein [Fulvivirga sediminis]MBL3657264.1 hypothetical protein [Fulvivirga sediminis]
MNASNLYHIPFEEIVLRVKDSFPHYEYDFKKHLIELQDDHFDKIGFVRLPLHLVINEQLQIIEESATVLYLSIESGYAAICIMEGKENDYHTTFSAYMTRKKQGFSQIKYLNKKGKSRAGSRVRLAATTEFFENINITLTDLFEDYEFDRIALNCNSTLIPYLFNSKEPCPFDKKDERLYKIPLHIPQSNYTNLDAAIKKLMAPTLFYNEGSDELFTTFN